MKTIPLVLVILSLASVTALAKSRILPGGEEEDYSAIKASNKGVELFDKGDYAGARKYYDAALHKDPTAWIIYYNRANLFLHEKQWQLALQDCNSCVRLKPSFFLAVSMRAHANQHLGNYGSSLADYDRILSLHPQPGSQALALSGRAWLEATCPNPTYRNPQKAISDAKAACNVSSWGNAVYIDTLACAYAEAGDFNSAVQFEEKAIACKHEPEESKGMQHRLDLFRQHKLSG